MSTVADTMQTLSNDIQLTFEELVKLLLRKTLKPILNPLGNNNIVYNSIKGKYERGLINSANNDNINRYTYTMTKESLGWSDEILAHFRINAKFIKSSVPQRFPSNTKYHNIMKPNAKISFSDKETKNIINQCGENAICQYKNLLSMLNTRNVTGILANKKATFNYSSDIPYTYTFKELEDIGKDIIDQTDPSIPGCDSARMSTAMLRVRLYNLEQNLAKLSVDKPDIFDAYIDMLRIINGVSRKKIVWVIKLIALLTYQRWEDLDKNKHQKYYEVLGDDFINSFNSNELITILLQSNSSEYIIKASLLFPLLKMLFIVFGYSKLVPVISDINAEAQAAEHERLRKFYDKYKGATIRRQSDDQNKFYETECAENNFNADHAIKQIYGKADPEPIDQCVYDFIRLFGDLYPTLIGLMGGTEKFPPESIEINCNEIPHSYEDLTIIPEFLWRFNDFSYCRYLEYICSKQLHNVLNYKVNEKTRYLQSI